MTGAIAKPAGPFLQRKCRVFIPWSLLKRNELQKKKWWLGTTDRVHFVCRPFINNTSPSNEFYLFVKVPFYSVIWWHPWQGQSIILYSMCVCLLFETGLIKARLVVKAPAFCSVRQKKRRASNFEVTVFLLAWQIKPLGEKKRKHKRWSHSFCKVLTLILLEPHRKCMSPSSTDSDSDPSSTYSGLHFHPLFHPRILNTDTINSSQEVHTTVF